MLIQRHRIFVFLSCMLVLRLVIACSSPAQNLQGEQWVIFPAEQASEQDLGDWLVGNGQTAEYWTPSEEDVLALEDGLGSFLQQTNSDRFDLQKEPIWKRLDEYNRQYIGIILDGKKIIYANYFCNSVEMDWRKDYLFVMDGGDCFFHFEYDTDSKEFFGLQVNGNG
jgi:hypothetical protein